MVGYTKFNRPIQAAYKSFEKRRRVMKQMRKKEKGVKVIPVADPELMSASILKKRSTNPRANITLSGKKKRKILKRLRKTHAEKSRMEVEPAPAKRKRPKETKTKNKQSRPNIDNDVEMKE